MRTIEANGATIRIPDRCECGDTCPDKIAADHVHAWNKSGRRCAFCGQLIRVVSFTMKHYHPDEHDPLSRWSSADWAEYEPNWTWYTYNIYGCVNIDAHVSCARKAMPHADFEKIVYGRPEVISASEIPKDVRRGPCADCGAVPTDEDVRRVCARVFNFHGPCVYCGKRIMLRSLSLFHGTPLREHTGRWSWDEYEKEPTLYWAGYRFDVKEHTRLEFVGHLVCAVKAMPYAQWYEVNKLFWVKEAQWKVN